MSIDGLDTFRVRVEAARMQGEMRQYVEDVSLLLRIIDGMEGVIERYGDRVDAANTRVGILAAQAAMDDNPESPKHDRALLLKGARQVVDVFNGVIG
mgnify:CR=1 FL=1